MLANIIFGLIILVLAFFLLKCLLIKKKPYYLITVSIIGISSLLFMPKLIDYIVTYLQLTQVIGGDLNNTEMLKAIKSNTSSSAEIGKDLIFYAIIFFVITYIIDSYFQKHSEELEHEKYKSRSTIIQARASNINNFLEINETSYSNIDQQIDDFLKG